MHTELSPVFRELVRHYSGHLRFWLNGREVRIANPDPTLTLVDYLRDAGLTGTKVGCGQGGCGACTVMVSRQTPGGATHAPVNACLRPLAACAGDHISTVEGIGNPTEGLDAVQHRIALHNGTQCGFCTPGFVMNMHAYLRNHPAPNRQQVEDAFGGNLCRCTGYRPILDGMGTFATDAPPASKPCEADPFFPLKLRSGPVAVEVPAARPEPLYFVSGKTHWFRPASLAEALELKRVASDSLGREQVKPVVGNTASGIYPDETARCYIDLSRVPELNVLAASGDGLTVGAAVSIQHLLEFAEYQVARIPAEKSVGLRELVRHGSFLAGLQVRSAGSVGGNLFITKSHTRGHHPFPSDLFTVLAALGTTLSVASAEYPGGAKRFELNDLPATQDLPADSLLLELHIPLTTRGEFVQTHRVARRPQMAHPIVNAGFRCKLDASGKVEDAVVVYGGLGSCNARLPKTEAALRGRTWDAETLKVALGALSDEAAAYPQATDAEGFTGAYRTQLARGFFYKFFLHVAEQLAPGSVDAKNRTAAAHHTRPISRGQHTFSTDAGVTPLTRPIAKRAGFSQAAGEIRYPYDEPVPPNGFQGVVVPSTRPHARFGFSKPLSDLEADLRERFPGFVALVTAADIPGAKLIGLGGDDPILFDGEVTCIGAPLALAVATDRRVAQDVAEYVGAECVAYTDLPAIVTLDDAVAKKSIMPPVPSLHPAPDGRHVVVTREGSNEEWVANPAAPLQIGTAVASGGLQTGAQAHFYMEPMCALAVPGAYDQMLIYSSTQNPNGDQGQIARVLGVKANNVTILLEQIGGGFGGKQNRAVFPAAIAAVAARRLRKPVRVAFDRETDMHYVGKRHPYRGAYHVAYAPDGTIKGMRLDYCSDGGNTIDISFAVLKGSVMMSDGCYGIPTFQAGGTVYKTHKASNTAFRTFGQVQPHLIQEEAVERVAFELSQQLGRRVRAEEVRTKNLYRSAAFENAASTHFGQPIWFCELRERWDSLYTSSRFEERTREVEEFNRTNRWRKRGISMTSLKYGIGFKQLAALNTSSAVVQINKDDGSVTVVHGGVEMGQGLHTKIAQVAAKELGIGLEFVRVAGNNTDTIPNAAPTAASTGFDLNGGAVAAACRVLKARLEEFCITYEADLKAAGVTDWREQWATCWPKLVVIAWLKRVPLIAAELFAAPHYETPVQNFPRGKFFAYFAYGFSVSEVEIDVLTGEHTVLRADLLYDAGQSPNPAIDIGQIEGGYVQGLGFLTTEEIIYDDSGRLVTDNVWSYKPPCSKSIPLDMRVALAEHSPESRAAQEKAGLLAVAASKSAAEPTLSLAVSAYFAIKQAIRAARAEQTGTEEWVRLDVPATCQRIQQACAVSAEQMTK